LQLEQPADNAVNQEMLLCFYCWNHRNHINTSCLL